MRQSQVLKKPNPNDQKEPDDVCSLDRFGLPVLRSSIRHFANGGAKVGLKHRPTGGVVKR